MMVGKPREYDLTFFDNRKMTTKDTHLFIILTVILSKKWGHVELSSADHQIKRDAYYGIFTAYSERHFSLIQAPIIHVLKFCLKPYKAT